MTRCSRAPGLWHTATVVFGWNGIHCNDRRQKILFLIARHHLRLQGFMHLTCVVKFSERFHVASLRIHNFLCSFPFCDVLCTLYLSLVADRYRICKDFFFCPDTHRAQFAQHAVLHWTFFYGFLCEIFVSRWLYPRCLWRNLSGWVANRDIHLCFSGRTLILNTKLVFLCGRCWFRVLQNIPAVRSWSLNKKGIFILVTLFCQTNNYLVCSGCHATDYTPKHWMSYAVHFKQKMWNALERWAYQDPSVRKLYELFTQAVM